jgi:hypothetical protein
MSMKYLLAQSIVVAHAFFPAKLPEAGGKNGTVPRF